MNRALPLRATRASHHVDILKLGAESPSYTSRSAVLIHTTEHPKFITMAPGKILGEEDLSPFRSHNVPTMLQMAGSRSRA